MHGAPSLVSAAAARGPIAGTVAHPYLRDRERARAFDLIGRNPCGTEREWAATLGWKRSKVTRFLVAIEKCGLAEVERTAYGTRVRIRSGPGPQPNHVGRALGDNGDPETVQLRTIVEPSAGRLETLATKNTRPRDLDGDVDYPRALISVMNKELGRRFPSEYKPVLEDNFASIQAASRLQTEFPLAEVIRVLEASIRLFNPSKHGKGKLPGTLKYFESGIRDRLQQSRGDQDGARKESYGRPTPPISITKRPDNAELRLASPETIGTVMQSLRPRLMPR